MADIELNADPESTIGATEEYKAAWHEKYGKDEPDPVDVEAIELEEDPASTFGATDEYKEKWHAEYGNAEPKGNASKAEWVDYAVAQGADRDEAEDSTVADLKAAYGGSGVASAPSQGGSNLSTAEADAASGSAPAGGGVDSGTAEGTPSTSTSPATGTKGN